MIARDWYEILRYDVGADGRCKHCDAALPGRFESYDGAWGRRRVPVRIALSA